jgi:hypothetical protein
MKAMTRNPILEELYAVRDQLLEEAGGDLHRLAQDANRRAVESGREIIDPAVLRQEREQRDRVLAQQLAIVLPISMPTSDQNIGAE